MPIDISYNGSSIYTSSSGTDVKLLTSGKFMEDDVLVSIPVGTEGTPTATKGTVTSNSVSVTPSVTNSEGYISGGNHTGTAVTVSASELVSGTKTISASGTTDVTNYANASVASGSATTPATTITANPSISVSSSGLITASVSASQNVTPTVSAGYVSSGTAGSVAVSGSNTEQLTTQAAQTIHPSTTDQTIASGKYLTGAQTVKGVLLTNLSAGNIKKDVVVKVGDSTDDDCVTSVTGTFEGGGGSSYTLLATEDVEVNTTSTSSETVTTINLSPAPSVGDLIYVRITDKAGKRNGYWYQSNSWIVYNGGSANNAGARGCFYVNSSGFLQQYYSGYGVYLYGYSTSTLTISARYNSSYGTINGTYAIEVYKLDWPDNVNPYS